jgi:hypothetical protein
LQREFRALGLCEHSGDDGWLTQQTVLLKITFRYQECELNLANIYQSEAEFDEDYTLPPFGNICFFNESSSQNKQNLNFHFSGVEFAKAQRKRRKKLNGELKSCKLESSS